MSKRRTGIFISFLSVFTLLSGCTKEPAKLDSVTGIKYEDGILSFTEVEGATGYNINFYHKEELVYTDKISGTAIDVESLGLEGNILFVISAYNDKVESESTDFEFIVYTAFTDVIIEAEDNLYNFGTGKEQSNFRNNPAAHKGAYVGGLDDAGHGIYINYLSPFDGTFDVESYYCWHKTSSINQAQHEIRVNGETAGMFTYTEDTGWGGATFNPAVTTASITLKKGWNTIAIMKNGDHTDNWGDFAEIDYIKIKGNNEKYNIDDLDIYGARPPKYRLEAEMGSPRKKDVGSGLYLAKNPCIKEDENTTYSNGFLMGGIENKYDGVEWHFDSSVKAKYKIQIAYAAGQFDGSTKARPTFIVTQAAVTPAKSIDLLDFPMQQMEQLDYTGWNYPVLAEETIELTLEKGDNFIYCIKLDNSGFFQIDYCDLTFVEEVV